MSRVDITATASMAMWQERIEKERAHATTRQSFTTNPKTMYVVTEKPHATAWSREFQAKRAEEQAKLDTPDIPVSGYFSPLTPMLPGAAAALQAQAQAQATAAAAQKHTYKPKGGGAAPVNTAVTLTSPLTHTTTVVGTGSGAAPPSPVAAAAGGAGMTAAASPPKASATTKWTLSNAGAAIASPSASATMSGTLSATAKPQEAKASLTHTHMRSAVVRRPHPLESSDPALAATLRRHQLAPTEKWEWPQTTAHEYGWNQHPVMPADRATHLWSRPLKSSDVSLYVSNYVNTVGAGKTPFSTGSRPA